MIQVHSLQRAGAEDLYVLTYTDPNYPDQATNTIYQGSEKEVRDFMAAGGLSKVAIDQRFASRHGKQRRSRK